VRSSWREIAAVIRRLLFGLLLIAAASLLLLFSESGRGAEKGPGAPQRRLYFTGYTDSPMNEDCLQGVLDGLASAGWVRGRDYDLTIRNAQGDMTTLNSIIDDAAQRRPDVLFTSSTPTLQVALRKITDFPVVFTNSADPLAAGAGLSFENHRPNVTGTCTMSDFDGMVSFLEALKPGVDLIGTLFVPGEINSVVYRDRLERTARRAGIALESIPVSSPSEVSGAAQVLCSKGIDAVVQVADNLTSASIAGIIQQARVSHIPVLVFLSEDVRQGAVAAVARDYRQAGRDAAKSALRILGGESCARIPIRLVSRTKVIINARAAREFGLPLNDALRRRADEVVEDR